MTSLRRTIIVRTVIMLAAVGCLAAAGVYQAALYEANQFMDDYMRQFAEVTTAGAIATGTSSPLSEPEDRFEQIVWIDGNRTATTPRAPAGIGRPIRSGFDRVRSGGADWRTYASVGPSSARLLVQRMSARRELARHAAIEISLVIATTMLIVWLIVTLTVGRVMRHFEEVGAEVATRGLDAVGPLPLRGLPGEIRPLVGAMNVLIERQGVALRRQRLFIADSAHELRTPLTALRIQIENLRGVEATRVATDALEKGIVRASAMLNQLLQMARFDVARAEEAVEDLDLAEVVKQCVADVVEIACGAGVDLGLVRCDPAVVRLPRGDAQVLVSNIVDNAIAYTPPGGSVDCTLRVEGEAAIVEIVDTGPGVKPDDLPRLFDRFFRAAPLDKMGSGLGLAIVKAIADRNGVTVGVANRASAHGLEVRVGIPLAAPPRQLRSVGGDGARLPAANSTA